MGSRFETDESLGLTLRSQIFDAAGPRLINSNRAQMSAGAGLGVNKESGVGVEPREMSRALAVPHVVLHLRSSEDESRLQYYPSLTDIARHRVQFDADVRRELWKDFFVSLNGFNTYDSRPPNIAAKSDDVGIAFSIGWSY